MEAQEINGPPSLSGSEMLKVLSHHRKVCSAITRRDLLQVGGLGAIGLSLDSLLIQQASAEAIVTSTAPGFGQAKNCILLFLYGSPSQLETFDMKPDAPIEIRGPMQPIASSLPGMDVCELLPETAKVMDKTTIIRSMTHPYPIHGVAYATTGVPAIDVAMELAPNDLRHHPYFGSAVEYFDRQKRSAVESFPQNVALPFHMSSERTGEVYRAGPYAAFLGSTYNPIWTEYIGKATRSVEKTLRDEILDCWDPYVACDKESHFRLSAANRPDDISIDRLSRRRSLVEQFDQNRRHLEQSQAGKSLSRMQELAYSLISSNTVGEALDPRHESPATQDRYGRTLFGQSCLTARRMVEAGTRLVSVFWDEYGLAGDAWDTHWNHFPRMNDQLMPGLDKGFAGLIGDLDDRGMLDETLVVCLSEHGRTPKLKTGRGGGRDHWSRAYSVALAGGGIARGKVIGKTDQHAGDVADNPISPKDVLATMYHLLGISPFQTLPDKTGRQMPLLPEETRVIEEALA
jgi:hypothetical protein